MIICCYNYKLNSFILNILSSSRGSCIRVLFPVSDNATKICYKPNGNSSTAPLIPGVYNKRLRS